MNFEIFILTNTFCDLSKLDFGFVDIYILDIESQEFKDYISSLNPEYFERNYDFFQSIIDDSTDIKDNKRYAVFKRDYNNNYDEKNLHHVFRLLLIIFPSEIIIEHTISFNEDESFVQSLSMSTWAEHTTFDYKYLWYEDVKLPLINEFIALAFERMKNTSCIGLCIENYIISYSASHIHFQYITFCMSLENIVPGPQELSYRLKRAVAILCGDNLEESQLIFRNINKIYALRSKIVHGVEFDMELLQNYLVYLNAIVSLLIIELLVHNIGDNQQLNERLTEIGFGNRSQITNNWKHFVLNPLVYNKIRYVQLQ